MDGSFKAVLRCILPIITKLQTYSYIFPEIFFRSSEKNLSLGEFSNKKKLY
jgi:hypothetical protein